MIFTKLKDTLTLALVLANYGCWAVLFVYFNDTPLALLILFGSLTMAFQGSLQHELIHHHPFKWQPLNDFLGHFTGNPWLPYALYKESHLRHHVCPQYAHPDYDPETFLISEEKYFSFPRWIQRVFDCNQSLIGRILVGPLISLGWVVGKEIRHLSKGEFASLLSFLPHILIWSGLLFMMEQLEIPFWKYLICVAFPGYSLILIRSFLEHRIALQRNLQTCIVESGPFWSFLFLNNNLHFVHHSNMDLAWYELPKSYREQRDQWLKKNGNYFFASYFEIFKRYSLQPKGQAWASKELLRPL